MRTTGITIVDKGRVEIETFEVDETLAADEMLVRNRVSLISPGTELAFLQKTHRGFEVDWFPYASYPHKPGYSAIGDVIKIGSAVTEFKLGDRVHNNGPHQTYSKIAAARCLKMPEALSDDRGPFFQLLKVAMSGIRRAPVGLGENVVVIGMGIIGNLCAQLCKLTGAANVAGVDLSEQRLAKARECGIDRTWNTANKSLVDWIKELEPAQAELIFEAVGAAATIDAALKAVAQNGRVALLGSPRSLMEIDPYFDIHRKAIHVIGVYSSGLSPERQKREEYWLLQLLATQRVVVDPMITTRLPLEKAPQAYEWLVQKGGDYMGILLDYPKN